MQEKEAKEKAIRLSGGLIAASFSIPCKAGMSPFYISALQGKDLDEIQ